MANGHEEGAVVREFAPAKINLALHVTGRRPDGFHLLDSLVAFADIGDDLTLRAADQTRLDVQGPFAAGLPTGNDNLVLRAVSALSDECAGALPPVHIVLQKNLPAASGIGGGSADAAATLRGLMRLFGLRLEPGTLKALALKLGADVPVCIESEQCRMSGIGEIVTSVPQFRALQAVLVNPGIEVATGEIFSCLGRKSGTEPHPALPDAAATDFASIAAMIAWLSACRNDLETPACAQAPEIADCLQCLEETGSALLTRMSGSGATCFAIFENEQTALAAATAVSTSRPNWWVKPVTIN